MEVDRSAGKGSYILTGSSAAGRETYSHSGAGRIAKLRMGTMSLYETGDSDEKVSLKGLFERDLRMMECARTEFDDLIGYIVRGGWPGSAGLSISEAESAAARHLESLLDDVCLAGGRRRSRRKMEAVFRSLCRSE